MARQLDFAVFGATGFTGQLVSKFLDCQVCHAPGALRWAIAGRNAEKLNKLKEELRSNPQVLLADVDDRPSLVRLAALAKAVGTTVGPYARYGTELVSACVEVGTHYCDLAGEIPWIRASIDTFDAAARAKKVRVVHCCGYDSIPFDIPVYLMQRLAHKEFGALLTKVHTGLTAARGGVSGGTVHSLLGLLDDANKNEAVTRLLKDPLALVPEGDHSGRPKEVQMSPRYRPPFGWTAPHLMAPINSRVVRRSQSLLHDLYPPALEYDEFIACGEGFAGWAKAQVIAGFFGLFLGVLGVGQVRRFLVRRVLPKPGGGPSRKTRETGYFAIRSLGEGQPEGGHPFRIEAHVTGQGDPGYDATARMLGTSLLCLAQEKLEHTCRYGVLTPASCFGDVIARELERQAITFHVQVLPTAG